MIRSPQDLRSGRKGQPVSLESDKPAKGQRSLSAQSAGSSLSLSTTTMPAGTNVIDPALLAKYVGDFLEDDNNFGRLVAKLSEAMKPIIEQAVQTAVHSVLTTVKEEVKQLQKEVASLREDLVDRTEELEQYQRRNNIRIFGVKETKGENTDNLVVELCREKLGLELPPSAISRSHRVGRPRHPVAGDIKEQRRAIIVRFTTYRSREMVFGAKKRLKGTGVTIREDLTSRRLELLRRATALYGVRNAWTFDGRVLYIDQHGKKGVATRMRDLPEDGRG